MKWVARIGAGVVLVLLASAGYVGWSAVQSSRTIVLPELRGGSPVGRRELTWVDSSRHETLSPSAGRRTIAAWIWYPAAHAVRTTGAAPYSPGRWDAVRFPGLVGLGQTRFSRIRTWAVEAAAPLPGAHPLIVLAPGLGFAAMQYQAFAESLAAHGYAVVAITPTYSSNVTVLDGQVRRQTARGSLPDGSLYDPTIRRAAARLLDTWVADARFAAARSRAAFPGLRVARATVYVGHSFGGATALEACWEDSRCAGAVNIDGLDLGAVTSHGLDVPMLLLGHQNSCVTGVCRPATVDDRRDRRLARSMVAAGRGPSWSVVLDGTEHFDFTDYAAYRLALPLHMLLPLGSASGDATLRRTERCVLDLADRATRGEVHEGCLTRVTRGRTVGW